MKYITVKLTEDQANQIVRILDYGKADMEEEWSDSQNRFVKYYTPEDKKFNAFIQRIQQKIIAELVKL